MSPAGRQLPLAILISGRGSNMAAIAQACAAGAIAARVALVIADQPQAGGIELARSLDLPVRVVTPGAHTDRAAFEAALSAAIDASGAELIVLAGFMRVLSASFVRHYEGRLLNIHPSLLPAYQGLHTHRRVLEAGERVHGVSVHVVTAQLDGGPVICQARLLIQPGESEQSLAARVQRLEHRIYPHVIGLMASGRLRLEGGRILLDGRVQSAPIVEEEAVASTSTPE